MGDRKDIQQGAAPTGPEPSQVEPGKPVSPLRASVSSTGHLRILPATEMPRDGTTCLVLDGSDDPAILWQWDGDHGHMVEQQHIHQLDGWLREASICVVMDDLVAFLRNCARDQRAEREDAGRLRSKTASPMPEGQAPASQDLKALQAENARLTTALAESERNRKEAEARNTAFTRLARLIGEQAVDPAIRQTINDLLGIKDLLSTPTPSQPRGERS
ncbi:hypothetical protein [Methylobacterium sp. Gmos1]